MSKSLLDDARRLADGPKPTFWDSEPTGTINPRWHTPDVGPVLKCAYCRQKLHAHDVGCPVASLPRIVAALEAAERVTRAQPIADPPGRWGWDGPPSQAGECVFCRVLDRGKDTEHATVCPWQALVAALRARELTPN